MGAFFNNIQVRPTDADTNAMRDRIIEQTLLLHSQDDYELTANEDPARHSLPVDPPCCRS